MRFAPAATLIPPGRHVGLADDRGHGLPGLLDAIRDRGDGRFEQIRDELRSLFPSVHLLQLQPVSETEKVVQVELRDGIRVPAEFMSEGLLFFLGFSAVAKADGVSLLLIEEPENGLHPGRIAEVMKVLRKVSESTQVLLTTHSPLVVNELSGDEVSVLTRREPEGTKAVLLRDTANYAERSKVYQNGELWRSYCDGNFEEPLLGTEVEAR